VGNLRNRIVCFLILVTSLCVLITGLTSELYLGDEVYHYRFAKQMYEAGRRVSYDSLYESGMPPGYFYRSDPLWNGLLAILWKIFGGISFPVAQIYHTCFYALLLAFTYLVAKEIFGEREGIWACLILASMPMAIAFGILFYVDVPATALSMVAFYCVIRKKYLWAGLFFPLMYLTKRNACFLIPAMVLIPLYLEKQGLLKKLRKLSVLLIPLCAASVWDMWWRYQHVDRLTSQMPGVGNIRPITTLAYLKVRLSKMIWGSREYLNSSLINPIDLIKYLGVVVILLVVFYFVRGLFKREKGEEKVLVWGTVGSYFIFFLFLFGFNSDIRYLFPIVPLLCFFASRAITFLQRKWISIMIIGVCLFQFGATLAYVHRERQVPKDIKEGLSYIRTYLPKEALFMYPEYIFVEATERKFIWDSFFYVESLILAGRYGSYQGTDMNYAFFWNTHEEDLRRSLRVNKVDYIVIKKSRIYDDSKVKHFGGYPKSFVQRLPTFQFLRLTYENPGISIWEVCRDALRR